MNKINNIDDLISKFLSGNALPDEAIVLEDWRKECPGNQLYFLDCEKIFALNKRQSSFENIDGTNAWEKVARATNNGPILPIRKNKYNYLKIAASLILLLGIGAFAGYFFNKGTDREISYTTLDKQQFITLDDSSEINILENSKIIIDKNFGITNRSVRLRGNADFTIRHKDKLPFIVDAGNFFIKDIGTKFSVRLSLNTDTVYVKVKEGIVLLSNSLGAELEVKAGGEAIYIHSTKQLINATKTKTNVILKFDNSSLKEVVLKLNSTYKTHIVLQSSQLNNCTITTTFTNENIEAIITVITETLGLSFEKTTSGYLIKGNKCQQ